jgi:hypothetical protein
MAQQQAISHEEGLLGLSDNGEHGQLVTGALLLALETGSAKACWVERGGQM